MQPLSLLLAPFPSPWLLNPPKFLFCLLDKLLRRVKLVISYLLVALLQNCKRINVASSKLPADERRAVTVDTVVELAAEQNPSDITTGAIAKRMGLTQGALFRHFPNKDAILQAVMEWVAEHLLSRIDRAANEAGPSPLAALEAVYRTHIDFVASHPGVPRILFGELQRPDESATRRMVRTLIQRYGERVRGLLDAGKEAGEVDPTVDTAAAALLFIGTIQGLVMQSLIAGNVEHLRTEAPRVFALYLRGIRRTA